MLFYLACILLFVSDKNLLKKYLFIYFTAHLQKYFNPYPIRQSFRVRLFSSKTRFKKIKMIFTLLFVTMNTFYFFNFINFSVKSWYFSGIWDSSRKTTHQLIEVLTHFLVTMVVKQTIGTIHYIRTVFGVWIYIGILQTLQRFGLSLLQFVYFVYLMIGIIKPIVPNDLIAVKFKVN